MKILSSLFVMVLFLFTACFVSAASFYDYFPINQKKAGAIGPAESCTMNWNYFPMFVTGSGSAHGALTKQGGTYPGDVILFETYCYGNFYDKHWELFRAQTGNLPQPFVCLCEGRDDVLNGYHSNQGSMTWYTEMYTTIVKDGVTTFTGYFSGEGEPYAPYWLDFNSYMEIHNIGNVVWRNNVTGQLVYGTINHTLTWTYEANVFNCQVNQYKNTLHLEEDYVHSFPGNYYHAIWSDDRAWGVGFWIINHTYPEGQNNMRTGAWWNW